MRAAAIYALLFAFHVIVGIHVSNHVYKTQPVVPADGDQTLFSEARALQHVHVLSVEIHDRQVSTPGLQQAAAYLEGQCFALVQAVTRTRPDLNASFARTRVSGAGRMDFMHRNFTSVYRDLSNVELTIAPVLEPGKAAPPALLVIAHFDSPVCSQGASDDASQIAIMLEAARALIADASKPLATSITFLFNGGEETLSQAAHGFSRQSPLMPTFGAFINLESTGPGGVPIVFQHTGAWTLEAYARGAPHARGSRIAQEVFESGIIPADSDFRMFSARHYGDLPGIDVAFVMDAAAYHTYDDSYTRLRPGTLQEMGENLLGAMHSFAAVLAASAPRPTTAANASSGSTNTAATIARAADDGLTRQQAEDEASEARQSAGPTSPGSKDVHVACGSHEQHVGSADAVIAAAAAAAEELAAAAPGGVVATGAAVSAPRAPAATDRAVFFELPVQYMVVYSEATANLLHHVPLFLILLVPTLHTQEGAVGPTAISSRVLWAAGKGLLSMLLVMLLPALGGVLRAYITGVHMVWFAQHWLAYAFYMPLAVAGGLLPWMGVRATAEQLSSDKRGSFLASQVLGVGLTSSAIASAATAGGLMGVGSIFFMTGAVALLGCAMMEGPVRLPMLLNLLSAALIPTAIQSGLTTIYARVLMERMSLTGHVHPLLGDGVVGCIMGVVLLANTGSVLLPLWAYALGSSGGSSSSSSSKRRQASKASGSVATKGADDGHAAVTAASSNQQRSGSTANVGSKGSNRGRRAGGVSGWQLLALASLLSAAVAGYAHHRNIAPYSSHRPRRLVLTHLYGNVDAPCRLSRLDPSAMQAAATISGADGSSQCSQHGSSSSSREDSGRVGVEEATKTMRRVVGISDSTPLDLKHLNLTWIQDDVAGTSRLLPVAASDFAFLFPVSGLLAQVVVEVPWAPHPQLRLPPVMRLAVAVEGQAVATNVQTVAALTDERVIADKAEAGLWSTEEQQAAASAPQTAGSVGETNSCQAGNLEGSGSCGSAWEPAAAEVGAVDGRFHLEVHSEKPCWGVMNVTGPLVGWSFGSDLTPSPSEGGPAGAIQHIVRFSLEDISMPWEFWLQRPPDEEQQRLQPQLLRVELSVTYLEHSQLLKEDWARLPQHVAPLFLSTVFQSVYEL